MEKTILNVIDFGLFTTSTLDFIEAFLFDLTENNKKSIKKLNNARSIIEFKSTSVYFAKLMMHFSEFSHER